VKLVDRRVFIDASPEEVYELLTDARLLVEWMAPIADIDPRTGGTITWTTSTATRSRARSSS